MSKNYLVQTKKRIQSFKTFGQAADQVVKDIGALDGSSKRHIRLILEGAPFASVASLPLLHGSNALNVVNEEFSQSGAIVEFDAAE